MKSQGERTSSRVYIGGWKKEISKHHYQGGRTESAGEQQNRKATRGRLALGSTSRGAG